MPVYYKNEVLKYNGTLLTEFLTLTKIASLKFKPIEDNETIDIEEIKHEELEILQEILGKCDLWEGNEEYILKVINENNNRLVKAILKISKENETLTKAVKQLNKEIKSIKESNI